MSKPIDLPVEKVAMNIVYQIMDDLMEQGKVDVNFRQQNNDRYIDFTAKVITSLLKDVERDNEEISEEQQNAIIDHILDTKTLNSGKKTVLNRVVKCPVCGGKCFVSGNFYNPLPVSSTTADLTTQCRSCNGKGYLNI